MTTQFPFCCNRFYFNFNQNVENSTLNKEFSLLKKNENIIWKNINEKSNLAHCFIVGDNRKIITTKKNK